MSRKFYHFVAVAMMALAFTACHVTYNFRDGAIPPQIKTVKINFILNRASYVNPQVAQKFYERIQQKIISNTKLTRTNDDNADYVISGTITTYDPTQTVGVSGQASSTNRLTVTLHMILKDNKMPPESNASKEFDVSRNFDYSSTLSLQQAEAGLMDEMVRSLTDDIFNQIFSTF